MSDSRQATLVLIHGAWAGSWIWQDLTPLLEGVGLRVLTPDMPGTPDGPGAAFELSLDGCVAWVRSCCEQVEGPLILIGHSGGGVIATQAAEVLYEQVAGVGYVAGMMLPSGYGFAELITEVLPDLPEAAGIGPYLEWSDDRTASRVPAQAAQDIFMQDIEPQVARLAAARLCLQPEGTRAMTARWSPERFGSLPRLYVEARQDRSVILPVQRRMQALVPGAQVASLDTGHVPQVAQPALLARAVLAFVEQCCKSFVSRPSGGPKDIV